MKHLIYAIHSIGRRIFLLGGILLVAACDLPIDTHTMLKLGTDSPQYLSATLDEEESLVLGGLNGSGGTSGAADNTSTERPNYRLKSTRSLTVRQDASVPVSSNFFLEGSIAAEVGHREYALPEGVLLSSGTQLIDPIMLRFNSVGLRSEALLRRDFDWANSTLSIGAGGGVSWQDVEVRATSALLDLTERTDTKIPYAVIRGTWTSRQQPYGIEGNLRIHKAASVTASIGLTHRFSARTVQKNRRLRMLL